MKKIELLLGISNIILNSDDTNSTLQKVVRFLKEAVESDVCSIYLLGGKNRDKLILSATEGLSEQAVGNVSLGLKEGLTGLTYTRDNYTFIRNATAHERFLYFPGINEDPYNTFIGIPLKNRTHEFGVLVFQFLKNKRNTDILRKLLKAVAAQVSGLVLRHYLMQNDELEALQDNGEERVEKGIPLSSGIAFGEPVIVMSKLVEKTRHHDSPDAELAEFHKALEDTKKDLEALIGKMDSSRQQIASNIFETHLMMLNDITFRKDIEHHIIEKHKSASFGVRHVADKYIKRFRSINDAYLRERAQDIEDIAIRLLSHLGSVASQPELLENSIIFANRLTPGETASLDLEKVSGFVTEKDGVTSHTAILAKSMKIPAVTGIENISQKAEVSESVIVDGYEGLVIFNPTEETTQKYKAKKAESQIKDEDRQYACSNLVLGDGSKVRFFANVSSVLDSEKAEMFCADGIGLVRTEIFYLNNNSRVTMEERMDIYKNILRAFPDKPVVFRLLDIGSDKKSAYEAYEENPALGNRGVRLLLTDYRDMLESQLTALIRLSKSYKGVKILVPFVADVPEYIKVKETAELIAEKEQTTLPDMGVMLEIPSVLYQLDAFKGICQFFSIGTNDMFQYFFALDRGNPKVSSLYRPDNRSFLMLLERIFNKTKELEIPVEICGEMAADPDMLLKLISIGYRDFSVSPYAINELKYHVQQAHMIK